MIGIDRAAWSRSSRSSMARYMMFASVYFHHTTRMFEHILHDVLRELWPDPRALDPIDGVPALGRFSRARRARRQAQRGGRALREPHAHLRAGGGVQRRARPATPSKPARRRLRARFGDDNVWADEQSQLLHRLPFGVGGETGPSGSDGRPASVDAREVSDLIAKLSGKAYWRKLFVRRANVDVARGASSMRRGIATRCVPASSA